MLYTVTCIATAGSKDATRNKLRINPFPGNLKRSRTYASCVPIMTETINTHTITITELIKACPMSATWNALIKLSKFNQLFGSVITLVELYSSVVLNAVTTHEIIGTTAHREKKIKTTYFNTPQIIGPTETVFPDFVLTVAILVSSLRLCFSHCFFFFHTSFLCLV